MAPGSQSPIRRKPSGDESTVEGDLCPHCNEGTIVLTEGYEPYSADHLSCPVCDSTYPIYRYPKRKVADPQAAIYFSISLIVTILISALAIWCIATILER